MYRVTKPRFYKSLFRPVLTYESVCRLVTGGVGEWAVTWELILKRTFAYICEANVWRRRTNVENLQEFWCRQIY